MLSKSWAYNLSNKLVPRGRLVQNTFVAASGQALGYCVTLAAMPLLTRFFSPTEFGQYGTYLALLSVLATLMTCRYEVALVLPTSDSRAFSLYVIAIATSICMTVIIVVVLCAFGDLSPFRSFLTIGVFGVHLVCFGFFETTTNWAIRKKAFESVALMRFIQIVTCIATQLLFGSVLYLPAGLQLGSAAGCMIAVITVLHCHRSRLQLAHGFNFRDAIATACEYRRFPLIECPSVLISTIATALPPLYLFTMYGDEVAGSYALGTRVISMPIMLLGIAATRVYASEATDRIRSANGDMRRFFRTTMNSLLICAIPVVVVVSVICLFFFQTIFGPLWYEAGIYCLLVLPWTISHLLSNVLFPTVSFVDKTHYHLLGSVSFAVLLMAGFAFSFTFDLPPRAAVAVTACCGTIGCLLMVWIAWRVIPRPQLSISMVESVSDTNCVSCT